MNSGDLRKLWKQIVAGKTHGWEPGIAFEYLVLRAFELEGAKVQYSFPVRLSSGINEQIDGVVYVDDLSAVVESKDRDQIDVEPIAKLRNQLPRRPSAAIGVVFSRGGFTPPARALAQFLAPQTILLWDGDEIDFAMRRHTMCDGLRFKYEKAIEMGVPDFNLRTQEMP